MALAIEAGSEQYAPLARAILGGLTVSGIVTVFLVPSAYLVIHRRLDACGERTDTASPGDSSQTREVTA
jgi:Cu/Ag efflux pump CusA